MTKNPFVNAGAAFAYIVGLVAVVFYGGQAGGDEPSILYPIAALSVFVLSASVMAYLFFYQPLLSFMAGDHKVAVKLFMQEVAIFACFVLATLVCIKLFVIH